MISTYRYFRCVLLVGALMIVGCGGSDFDAGSGGIDPLSNAQQPETYTGKRDPVLLNEQNTMEYLDALFGLGVVSRIGAAVAGSAVSARSNLPLADKITFSRMIGVMAFLDGFIMRGQHAVNLANRTETQNCENEGSLSISDDLTDGVLPDAISFQFNNCLLDGVTFSGQILAVVESMDEMAVGNSEKRRVDFNNLRVSDGTNSYVYTGSQQYEFPNNATVVKTQLSERHLSSGEINLIKNLERNIAINSEISTISGYFFDHDQGYVKLTGSDDLRLALYDNILEKGHIFLRGGSNSSAAIGSQDSGYGRYYYVKLDADGDNHYESANLTDRSEDTNSGFQAGLGPKAKITKLLEEEYEFGLGERVTLGAYESYDVDSSLEDLTFVWTIELKPENSQTVLDIDTHSPINNGEASLQLDTLGEYKISLKVTDRDGNSDFTVATFVLANHPPTIHVYSSSESGIEQIELGQTKNLSLLVSDREEDREAVSQFPYSWGLQKPAGSAVFLENAQQRRADLTPDVLGTYLVSYQTTDSSGEVGQVEIKLIVVNTPPTAVIQMSSTVGTGGSIVGTTIRFDGVRSSDPSTYFHDLEFEWAVVLAPANSQALITKAPGHALGNFANFTPEVPGNYRVSLTVTDEYGASDITYKDFTVINP